MSVGSVSMVGANNYAQYNSKVNFKGKKADNNSAYNIQQVEVPATTGKKWGVGLASLFVTGLGQLINGEIGKGIGMFLATLGVGVASRLLAASGHFKSGIGLGLATSALAIYSVVDAVKNAKSTETIVSPKETVTDAET